MRQAVLSAIKWYYYRLKYEKFTLLWYLLIFPLIFSISLFLRGEFIKTVVYQGVRLPYIKFLLISWCLVWICYVTFNSVSRGVRKIRKMDFLKDSFFVSVISKLLESQIREILRFFSIYLPFLVVSGFFVKEIFICLLIFPILSFEIFFLALFTASFSFILRSSDYRAIRWIFRNLFEIVIPIFYSVFQVLPKSLHFLLYIFPFSLTFEAAKQIILLENLQESLSLISLSFILTLPWIPLSLFTFKYLFNYSRRRGLLSLQ